MKIKKAFFTGIVTFLPLFVTFLIVRWILNLLTQPFIGLIHWLMNSTSDPLADYLILSQIFILILLSAFIIFIGFLAQLFLSDTYFRTFDKIMLKIPIANKIYKAVQELLLIFFNQDRPTLANPVQVAFPNAHSKAIGFIINESISIPTSKKEFSAVYIPATPTPIFGYLLFMSKKNLDKSPLSAKKSIKFIISCGTIKLSEK